MEAGTGLKDGVVKSGEASVTIGNPGNDEKSKLRSGQSGCSHIIPGPGFGASRLPQNLAKGQRNAPTATSWGRGKAEGIGEKTIAKLAYRGSRSLPYNDETQSSA